MRRLRHQHPQLIPSASLPDHVVFVLIILAPAVSSAFALDHMQNQSFPSSSVSSAVMFASGCFVAQPQQIKFGEFWLTPTRTTLFNVATDPTEVVMTFSDLSYDQVVAEVSEVVGETLQENVKKFTVDDFYSYHDGLLDTAIALKNLRPKFVLVPLRGGLKPRQIIDGLLNHEITFEEFQFTHKAHPALAKEYFAKLRSILAGYSIANKDLRFAVLDAGIGGDSANILAKWLLKIHGELGGLWRIQMHILHTPDRSPINFEAVTRKSGNGIRFEVERHTVSNLLVEDWSPGMAIRTEFDGEILLYKPSIEPGAIFITRQDGSSFVYASPDVSRAVNKAISTLGTDRMHETLTRNPSLDSSGSYSKLIAR